MRTVTFHTGEPVFRRGDPSVSVYIIDRGEVLISGGEPGHEVEIIRLHDGDLFGESGVLENRSRSASAVAATDTVLLETDADSFLKAFGVDNDKALYLLKLLCRRLRDTTKQVTQNHTDHVPHGAPKDLSHATLKLIPDSERLFNMIGSETVTITKLPFLVGNRFGGEISPISTARNYCVPAATDSELSSPHFEVLFRDGKFVVRDLSSRVGTIVNGHVLSRYSPEPVAELHEGDNLIVAGRNLSPFRWRLVVEA